MTIRRRWEVDSRVESSTPTTMYACQSGSRGSGDRTIRATNQRPPAPLTSRLDNRCSTDRCRIPAPRARCAARSETPVFLPNRAGPRTQDAGVELTGEPVEL